MIEFARKFRVEDGDGNIVVEIQTLDEHPCSVCDDAVVHQDNEQSAQPVLRQQIHPSCCCFCYFYYDYLI